MPTLVAAVRARHGHPVSKRKPRKYEHVPVSRLNQLDPVQAREFDRRATDEEKATARAGMDVLLHMLRNVK